MHPNASRIAGHDVERPSVDVMRDVSVRLVKNHRAARPDHEASNHRAETAIVDVRRDALTGCVLVHDALVEHGGLDVLDSAGFLQTISQR